MSTVSRQGDTLSVDKSIVMWHTVLQVDHENAPVHVAITQNPLEFDARRYKAQVVMHKTRSLDCAKQVARYVRRHYDIADAVPVYRTNRKLEAKIGYACTTSSQYEPNERTPGWGIFQHIAATPIAQLLKESAGGLNAPRIRFVVYEIRAKRDGQPVRYRACTHKMSSVEDRFRRCPPDTLTNIDVVHVGKYETHEAALKDGPLIDPDALWSKRADVEYYRRILKLNEHGDLVWVADGTLAVREYAPGKCVVVGPHVYGLNTILWLMEKGDWPKGSIRSTPSAEVVEFTSRHEVT